MHFMRLNRVYLTSLNCICQMLTKFSWNAELYPSLKRKLNSSARVLDYIHKTSDKVVSRCGRAVDVKEMCQEVWCEFKVVGLHVKPNWTARSSSPWLPSRSQRDCDGVTKLYFWYPWKTIYSLVSISVSESVTFEVTDRKSVCIFNLVPELSRKNKPTWLRWHQNVAFEEGLQLRKIKCLTRIEFIFPTKWIEFYSTIFASLF